MTLARFRTKEPWSQSRCWPQLPVTCGQPLLSFITQPGCYLQHPSPVMEHLGARSQPSPACSHGRWTGRYGLKLLNFISGHRAG